MTILFAGGEEEAFVSVGTVTFSTSGSVHDATYSNGALRVDSSSSLTVDFADSSEFWVHWEGRIEFASFNAGTYFLLQEGTTDIIRLRAEATNPTKITFDFWNGSSWTLIGTDVLVNNTLTTIDFYVKLHASAGVFEMYKDGITAYSYTGNTTVSGATTANNIVFSGGTSAQNHYLSQVLVDTEITLGAKVATLSISADGTETDWTGDYTDVDEVGLADDDDFVEVNSAEALSGFVIGDSATPSNTTIKALVHSVRASRGAGGPQNLQLGTYQGGTNYPGASVSGLTLSLKPFQLVVLTDPDASAAWDDTKVATAQVTILSKA